MGINIKCTLFAVVTTFLVSTAALGESITCKTSAFTLTFTGNQTSGNINMTYPGIASGYSFANAVVNTVSVSDEDRANATASKSEAEQILNTDMDNLSESEITAYRNQIANADAILKSAYSKIYSVNQDDTQLGIYHYFTRNGEFTASSGMFSWLGVYPCQ